MNAEQFAMWLHGFFEIGGVRAITATEAQIINDHLDLVFNKVTPNRREEKTENEKLNEAVSKKAQEIDWEKIWREILEKQQPLPPYTPEIPLPNDPYQPIWVIPTGPDCTTYEATCEASSFPLTSPPPYTMESMRAGALPPLGLEGAVSYCQQTFKGADGKLQVRSPVTGEPITGRVTTSGVKRKLRPLCEFDENDPINFQSYCGGYVTGAPSGHQPILKQESLVLGGALERIRARFPYPPSGLSPFAGFPSPSGLSTVAAQISC